VVLRRWSTLPVEGLLCIWTKGVELHVGGTDADHQLLLSTIFAACLMYLMVITSTSSNLLYLEPRGELGSSPGGGLKFPNSSSVTHLELDVHLPFKLELPSTNEIFKMALRHGDLGLLIRHIISDDSMQIRDIWMCPQLHQLWHRPVPAMKVQISAMHRLSQIKLN
jgi:hypothetical protein